jgi:hypothetical protein
MPHCIVRAATACGKAGRRARADIGVEQPKCCGQAGCCGLAGCVIRATAAADMTRCIVGTMTTAYMACAIIGTVAAADMTGTVI